MVLWDWIGGVIAVAAAGHRLEAVWVARLSAAVNGDGEKSHRSSEDVQGSADWECWSCVNAFVEWRGGFAGFDGTMCCTC